MILVGSCSLDAPKSDFNDVDILKSIIRKQSTVLSENRLSVTLSDEEEAVITDVIESGSNKTGISGSCYTAKEKLKCLKVVLDTNVSAKCCNKVLKVLGVAHTPASSTVRRWLFATEAMHLLQLQHFLVSSNSFSLKLDGAATLSKVHVYGIGLINDQNEFMALGSFEETSADAETLSNLVYMVLQKQCKGMFLDVVKKIVSIGSDQARAQVKTNRLLIERFKKVSTDN